jgi:electron transfer flavoprotein alpha/beta subunit
MYLAELLGWPLITEVLGVTYNKLTDNSNRNNGKVAKKIADLEIESLSDDGLINQKIFLPLLLAVGNAPVPYLRVPTLKDRLKIQKDLLTTQEVTESTTKGARSLLTLNNLQREQKTRPTTLIDTGTSKDKAQLILAKLREQGANFKGPKGCGS